MTFLEFLKQYTESLKSKLGDKFDESMIDIPSLEKAYNEDIAGLKNKNSELLGKMKAAEEARKALESQVDIEEYKRLKEEAAQRTLESEEEAEKRAKEQKNIDFLIEREKNKLIGAQKKWESEKSEYEKQIQGITSKYHQKLIDLALTDHLKSVHVGDKYLKFVKSSFLGKAGVELGDDGNEKVIINQDGAAIPIKDYIATWSEEDEAKSVIVPPTNGGGGSHGSSGGKNVSRKQQLMDQLVEAEKKRDSQKMIIIQQQLETLPN